MLPGWAAGRLPLRGGNWWNGGNAGLAALNLLDPRGNRNWSVGARPASRTARCAVATATRLCLPHEGPPILGQVPKTVTAGPG